MTKALNIVVFENGLDYRTRECEKPQVAKIRVRGTEYKYCIIGTQYGHIHTAGGDVRTWASYSGACKFLKSYSPL